MRLACVLLLVIAFVTLCNADELKLCNIVTKHVKKMLDKNYSDQRIAKLLTKVCKRLPTEQDRCNTFVNQRLSSVITGLKAKLEVSTTCDSVVVQADEESLLALQDTTTYDPAFCDRCQTVVNSFSTYINQTVVLTKVEKKLVTLCDAFPESFYAICSSFLSSLFEEFLSSSLQGGSVSVCTKANFCQ
jgi:uncharacterized membrane-anchored protein YjiN (DUF445 family)